MKVVVAHLYPDYLNIYADRGNLAVLAGRARRRGIDLDVREIGLGDATPVDADLFYIGGGQDREQALIAPDLAGRGEALSEAVADSAVVLAVCGGYQLLGRYYRDRSGFEQPGAGVFPLHTVAGDRRLIGDVLIECELDPGERWTVVGFENHAGRTILDEDALAARSGRSGFRKRRQIRRRRLPARQCHRHVSPRAAATAKPAARGLAARTRGRAPHR